jgi:hypothetical protein
MVLRFGNIPGLFKSSGGGGGDLQTDLTGRYSHYNYTDVPGKPAKDYPEGTLFINTADNRIYMALTSSTAVETPSNLWVKFDETSGNPVDSSANTHAITNNGSTTYVAGKYGNACELNGSSQGFDVASNSDFDLDGNFTVEAWINFDSKTTQNQVLIRRYTDANNFYYMAVMASGNFQSYRVAQGTTSNSFISLDSEEVDTWHHYAIVGDRTANTTKIYIDGILRDTNTLDATAFVWGATDMSIGSDENAGGNFMDGNIDDLKIWGTVRNQSQILSDMAESGAVGTNWLYWDLIPA